MEVSRLSRARNDLIAVSPATEVPFREVAEALLHEVLPFHEQVVVRRHRVLDVCMDAAAGVL